MMRDGESTKSAHGSDAEYDFVQWTIQRLLGLNRKSDWLIGEPSRRTVELVISTHAKQRYMH